MIDTLGWVYFKRGQYEDALRTFQGALSVKPNNAAASYHLALTYQALGDDAAARTALETALKAAGFPGDPAKLETAIAVLPEKEGGG